MHGIKYVKKEEIRVKAKLGIPVSSFQILVLRVAVEAEVVQIKNQ